MRQVEQNCQRKHINDASPPSDRRVACVGFCHIFQPKRRDFIIMVMTDDDGQMGAHTQPKVVFLPMISLLNFDSLLLLVAYEGFV